MYIYIYMIPQLYSNCIPPLPLHRQAHTSVSNAGRRQCTPNGMSEPADKEQDDQNGSSSSGSEEEPRTKIPKTTQPTGRHYQYKKIGTLEPGEKKVNVFGVVTDFKEPFQTRGTDYCSFVTLVDDTSPTSGIKCTLFSKSPDKLPQIKQVGDIVCLHRVNSHKRDDALFLEGSSFSSSMCFDGKLGAQLSPRTGSVLYTCGAVEKEMVRQLRVWALKRERASFSRKLESVVPNCCFDLACQVVAVSDCRPQCEAIVLTVWDGTKFPLKTRRVDFSLLRASMSPHLLCAAGGLTEQVVIYKKTCFESAVGLQPGEIIQLHNLHSSGLPSQSTASSSSVPTVELCLTDDKPGRVITLSKQSPDYLEVKAELERAGGDKTIVTTFPAVLTNDVTAITATSHSHVNFVSLASIRSCSKVGLKFRSRVRVQGVSPTIVEEFVRKRCTSCEHLSDTSSNADMTSCPECNTSSWNYVFFFKLLLEDSSGFLEAYASDNNAISLLGNLQPVNPHSNPATRYQILSRLYFLTGGNDPLLTRMSSTLPRPWLDCCLLSYQHSSTDSATPKLSYHIFDTTLACDAREGGLVPS